MTCFLFWGVTAENGTMKASSPMRFVQKPHRSGGCGHPPAITGGGGTPPLQSMCKVLAIVLSFRADEIGEESHAHPFQYSPFQEKVDRVRWMRW